MGMNNSVTVKQVLRMTGKVYLFVAGPCLHRFLVESIPNPGTQTFCPVCGATMITTVADEISVFDAVYIEQMHVQNVQTTPPPLNEKTRRRV